MSWPTINGKPIATQAEWEYCEARAWTNAVVERGLRRSNLDAEEALAVVNLEITSKKIIAENTLR